jgi:hypothetical protein
VLGDRQKAAATELAQWWDGIRHGGMGSHAVLLAGPPGWGRSTVLSQLQAMTGGANAPVSLLVGINGRSLPDRPGPQAEALRDGLLGAEVRRQAAALLCRSRQRRAARLGAADSLLTSGMAGTISVVMAALAAAGEDGVVARAARIVAAVSASAPVLVVIDDADYVEAGLAVTMIENLIEHGDSQVLVVAAVDLGSDVAAALTSRARYGPTAGRVHRAAVDPRMGSRSRAELAREFSPDLTPAEAQQLARQTLTFAEIFAATRSGQLPPTR